MKKNYIKIIVLLFCATTFLPGINKLFAQCTPATASSNLDINNVNAGLLNGGDAWWDLTNAKYEVPKGSGKHSLYAGGLWIGGVDSAGNIKLAAQTYRQTGNDFWPGPVAPAGMLQNNVCSQFDQMWNINKQDVIDFLSGTPATTAMTTYPGTFNAQNFAPYFDANNDNQYDVTQGDYPYFDLSGQYNNGWNNYLHGDQSVWWVINDTGNVHTESGGATLGIEIREEAYSYSMPGTDIDYTTFYQYTLINKSNTPIFNMYFGQWVDPDLGNFEDDYVGCDVMRSMGYCYNGDPDDNGAFGYGINPPAIGVKVLQGPMADPMDMTDNDHDGVIDEPGEQILMSKFVYYNNVNNDPYGNPSTANHMYNYLKGIWGNGQAITYDEDGTNPLKPPCNYMFPDTTDPSFPNWKWTEATEGNPPGDRRFIMSCGPFTMLPGQIQYITIAVIWAQDSGNTGGVGPSVGALQVAADSVQSFFALRSGVTSVPENEPTISVMLFPNPFKTSATLSIKNPLHEKLNLKIYDVRGMLVKSYSNINDKFVINRNQLSSGFYFYKVENEKQHFVSGKFVIE